MSQIKATLAFVISFFVQAKLIRGILLSTFFIPGMVRFDVPIFILNAKNSYSKPRQFRVMPKKWLSDTHMVLASGQFSDLGFKYIRNTFKPKLLTVIDLREESHGFLNGDAVSAYQINNQLNRGKPYTEITKIENHFLDQLATSPWIFFIQKKPTQHLLPIIQTYTKPYAIESEQSLVKFYGYHYERVAVTDHEKPSLKEVDAFFNLVKKLPKGTTLYLHCLGGKGRTTTFMALLDIFYNAKQLSLDEILKRQAEIGGTDLKRLPPRNDPNYIRAKQRLAFIEAFYQHVKREDYALSEFRQFWVKNF